MLFSCLLCCESGAAHVRVFARFVCPPSALVQAERLHGVLVPCLCPLMARSSIFFFDLVLLFVLPLEARSTSRIAFLLEHFENRPEGSLPPPCLFFSRPVLDCLAFALVRRFHGWLEKDMDHGFLFLFCFLFLGTIPSLSLNLRPFRPVRLPPDLLHPMFVSFLSEPNDFHCVVLFFFSVWFFAPVRT